MNLWRLLMRIAVVFKQGRRHKWWRMALSALIVFVPIIAGLVILNASLQHVRADSDTVSKDALRTSWYPDQTGLTPGLVSGGTFGQLFNASVNGQVYAQPLVANGVVFVATETNNIYGLNAATGAQLWTRNLGTPFNPSDVTCSDLSPLVGITGTPVIDSATNVAYFTSKSYTNGSSGAVSIYMHAVSVATGEEQAGFPVLIQGIASNDPTHSFNSRDQLQRPGLLLMNGVVYAAFGGHCDRKPYEGWVVGVSTSGQLKALWTTEAGTTLPNTLGPGGGIWQSGGGLVSDGVGQIIFATGNGVVPPIGPGKNPPGQLAQAVTRLNVQSDGSLKATDFFSPYDSDTLNANDSDLGSGAPMELPSQYFGTSTYPHILLEAGKQGRLYMLNADNMGGRGQGPSGADAVINILGPNGGLWSKPSVWPGDGGYIYTTTAQGGGGSGKLKAYHYGLDGSGKPTLGLVASTSDTFGFGSGSPVITSSGTNSGSALVWVIWSADGTGSGAQLRAYDPVPVNGTLNLRYSVSIGTSSKFSSPGVDGNRIFVGTRDGHVLGFGAPVNTPLTGGSLDLGTVVVGKSAQGKLTLTANSNLSVSALASNNTVFRVGTPTPALPASLTSGATLDIPITFTPTTDGLVGANITVTTSAGKFSFAVSGTGESSTGMITVSPSPISFGGVAAGGTPVTATTTFTNSGASSITISQETLPKDPFSVSGLPAVNSTLAPNASVTVTLTFAPTITGSFTDALTLVTTGGTATVPISGTAGTPGNLQVTPATIDLGDVPIGGNGLATFTVKNTGGSTITITRSKLPIAGVGFTALTNLPEGTAVAPGISFTENVLFKPAAKGAQTDSWSLNSDDGSGVKTVTFNAKGVAAVANPILPTLYIGDVTVAQPTANTVIANLPVTLTAPSTSPITVNYTTKDGSATVANGDYTAASGSLTFNPGDTSKTIPITVHAHTSRSGLIDFSVTLSSPKNAILGDNTAKVWLVQRQGPYSVYIADAAVDVSGGKATETIPVTLSSAPASGETVSVVVASADGTAKAGTDYTAVQPTTLTFNSGETTKNLSVPVNKVGSGNKTFVMNLTTPSSNAQIGDAQAMVTIINGGAPPLPAVYISDLSLVLSSTGTSTANFTLTLSTASSLPVTVGYATHDGSATVSGGYYNQASGSVTFNPGEMSKTVPVTVNGSSIHGTGTYFYLNLHGITNAVLGDNAGRATLISQLGLYAATGYDITVFQNTTSPSLAQIIVSLDTPIENGQTVTLKVNTVDGTAISGSDKDYIALPVTTLTFNPGDQSLTVPIVINPNLNTSAPKTFTLTLMRFSSNVEVADTSTTVTIVSHA
ncbi:beta strand repeat-containing protein [Tengunoibacter tsumagoiensis]|uniref:Calx-beta domain-containing protein n=1 Tax=Tengunoibacter tsumagoiensis TaxID=2014871 RepID=A0A402A5T6_9CHLR|nr:Calx-beta domain-containing protein [Tengunoibacter tsumagoiensis]GCE14439.1 hypothetical protein KTT_42980 [Tengunoibacter tsumagoiensis]